jgi:hypothetical protein
MLAGVVLRRLGAFDRFYAGLKVLCVGCSRFAQP